MLRILSILILVFGWSALAGANPKANKSRKGTHFIASVDAGTAYGTGFTEGGSGFSLRSTVGVGGAFKGIPTRFYCVGVARMTAFSSKVNSGVSTSHIERNLVDLSLGLRVLHPIQRLRLLGELTLGSSMVNSTALLNKRQFFETDTKRFTFYSAIGVQYRLSQHFSLGAMLEWALPTSRPARDFVVEVSGLEDTLEMHGWTSVTGSMVVHF